MKTTKTTERKCLKTLKTTNNKLKNDQLKIMKIMDMPKNMISR